MTTLHSIMTNTAQTYAQGKCPIPAELIQLGSIFEDLYFLWDAYEESQWTQNNGNSNHIVYAGALHIGSKIFPSLRTPVVILIVVQCIKNIIEQHIKLYEALQVFKETIFTQYPRMHVWNRRKARSNNLINMGASAQLWINVHIIRNGRLLIKSLRCAWDVLKQLAILSKYYVDAYKLISIDTRSELHALAGLTANYKQFYDNLKSDKNFLVQTITANAAIIDSVLEQMGVQEKSSQWVTTVAKELEQASEITESIPIIMQLAQDTIRPLYIPGKVTGVQIEDLDAPEEFLDPYAELPIIRDLIYKPKGLFPPWRGKILKKKEHLPMQPINTEELKNNPKGSLTQKIKSLFK